MMFQTGIVLFCSQIFLQTLAGLVRPFFCVGVQVVLRFVEKDAQAVIGQVTVKWHPCLWCSVGEACGFHDGPHPSESLHP